MTGFIEAPDRGGVAARRPRATARSSSTTWARGALLDTAPFGLAHEPMPRERLAAGADVVTVQRRQAASAGRRRGSSSGRADLVARLRRDPLARAMRPDKAILAGGRGNARALPGRASRSRESRCGG